MPADEQDFRSSETGRRQSWHGAKRYVKRVLAMRVPHAVMRAGLRFRPGLREGGRLPAPAHLREVAGHAGGVSFVMLRPDECEIAKELYWGKGTRPRANDRFALEIFATLARESDAVLDIGAYTGIFTLVAAGANPSADVHAFEIVPEVYRLLFDNCVRNDALARITLHHIGLGTSGTSAQFPLRSGGASLPSFYSTRLHFADGVTVRIDGLDEQAAGIAADARVLMKIDVEGTEWEVLDGGRRLLETYRPNILCEILPRAADAERIDDLLTPLGYRFFLVRDRDLQPCERLRPDERYRDWLFTTLEPSQLASLGIAVA